MSYYIGFRFGWVRIGRHMLAWHDMTVYPYSGGRVLWTPWKVWWQ